MIRMVSVKNAHRTVIRIPLYNDYEGILEAFCKTTKEGSVLQQPVHNEDIELSVDDVCRIAKALQYERAISKDLEPTPSMQRFHKSITS